MNAFYLIHFTGILHRAIQKLWPLFHQNLWSFLYAFLNNHCKVYVSNNTSMDKKFMLIKISFFKQDTQYIVSPNYWHIETPQVSNDIPYNKNLPF